MKDARHRLFILAAGILFGTTGTAQALGAKGVSPLIVGAGRVVVGGALLMAVAIVFKEFKGKRHPRGPAIASVIAITVYQLSFFAAVRTTGVAIGTLVAIGSAPAITGVIELLRGQRPEQRWLPATLLAVVGCALLVLPQGNIGVKPLGILLALIAGAAWATYTLSGKALLDAGDSALGVMARAFGWSVLLMAPILLAAEPTRAFSGSVVLTLIYLGVIPTAIAYGLFGRGLRGLKPSTVTTLALAEPLTAGVLGVLVLDEQPGLLAICGAGLILSGLLLLVRRT